MEALLGQPTAAGRAFAAIKIMAVGDDLKAQAAEADACTAMLDYDFGQAASLERRARQQHREALQPAFDGAAALFGGRPQPALEGLKQFLGKGQNAGFTSLYATAAALCLNRLPEAASYFGRPETATTAIWPCYFLIGGLLDGAGGGALGAKMKFDEGARREHTRYRVNTVLAAVATMASGDVPAGAMALSRSTPNAPGFLRPVLVDLLANPSRAAAVQALATPRYWLMVNGYQPGELLAVKAEELPAMPAEAAPDVTIAPAEAGDAPAAAGPADPATAAATDASPAPAPASDGVPADPGVTSINPTTQAAKAYRSAVTHIANHAYGEAEAALDYSIRNEAFPEALLARGQLRYLRGEYRGAAADYAWAVRLRPDWAEAVYSLAQATDRLGDPRRASQLFGAALELGLPPPWRSMLARERETGKVSVLQRFDLSGRVAIVTGGTKGLGRAAADGLAEAGATVVVTSRHGDEAAAAAAELATAWGREASGLEADQAKAEDNERIVAEVLARHGRLDILVNNAGINIREPLVELQDEHWDQVMAVNLTGLMQLTRAAVKPMIERATAASSTSARCSPRLAVCGGTPTRPRKGRCCS